MSESTIPLTSDEERGGLLPTHAAQTEYVAAMERGYGFSAHGNLWHYRRPGGECATLEIGSGGRVLQHVEHGPLGLEWINESAKKMAARKGGAR